MSLYHNFAVSNELRDIASDHQWLLISQKERKPDSTTSYKVVLPEN